METLIVHPENKKQLSLIKKFLKALKVEFKTDKNSKNYNFSDLAGKLEWKGDGLEEQKKIRNEWQ